MSGSRPYSWCPSTFQLSSHAHVRAGIVVMLHKIR
nr:MAG TPA: hypothetical protein [Caudoviricetes sp.]